jgi:hypothetical protein
MLMPGLERVQLAMLFRLTLTVAPVLLTDRGVIVTPAAESVNVCPTPRAGVVNEPPARYIFSR